MSAKIAKTIVLAGCTALLGACATTPPPPDYSAFERHRPHSILILPPVNASVEINAPSAVMAASVRPLAEAGYYVVPVSNMMETFEHNGMLVAEDIHAIAPDTLRSIFGADAALYMTVNRFGSHYSVLDSATEVGVEAKLVDLHSGDLLWENTVNYAMSAPGQGGILGMLVSALMKQIAGSLMDSSWPASQIAMTTLFQGPRKVLDGPRRDDAAAHDNGVK